MPRAPCACRAAALFPVFVAVKTFVGAWRAPQAGPDLALARGPRVPRAPRPNSPSVPVPPRAAAAPGLAYYGFRFAFMTFLLDGPILFGARARVAAAAALTPSPRRCPAR